MKKHPMILVTGSTGFLGSELIKQLAANDQPIRAIKRSTSIIPDSLKHVSNIHWVDADVLDYFALQEAFENIQQVYHCAALVSFDPMHKKQLYNTNVQGTANVVNLCLDKGIQKLVHVSSIAALGDSKPNCPVTENNHWEYNHKKSHYAISKYESEMEVFRGIAEGLNAVVVNPSVIIGNSVQNVAMRALRDKVKNGITFCPEGICGLVDVQDVAYTMIALMNSNHTAQRYIINAENWSCYDLLTQIAHQLNVKPPRIKLKPWTEPTVLFINRIAHMIGLPTGGLTKSIIRIGFSQQAYANSKIKAATGINFRPVQQSIVSMTN